MAQMRRIRSEFVEMVPEEHDPPRFAWTDIVLARSLNKVQAVFLAGKIQTRLDATGIRVAATGVLWGRSYFFWRRLQARSRLGSERS